MAGVVAAVEVDEMLEDERIRGSLEVAMFGEIGGGGGGGRRDGDGDGEGMWDGTRGGTRAGLEAAGGWRRTAGVWSETERGSLAAKAERAEPVRRRDRQ